MGRWRDSGIRRQLVLASLGFHHPHRREFFGLQAMDLVRAALIPSYVLGEKGKAWHQDNGFMERHRKLDPHSDRAAERRYLIRSLLPLVEDLPGDTAEAGVFEGASSWFICHGLGRTHHAFDSFEGLPAPSVVDGDHWTRGELRASADAVKELLAPFDAHIHKGWIPDVFDQNVRELCFAHVDVDLYQPTLDSLRFFYPKLVPGGIIVCDDYGFVASPGARKALNEYMADKPEPVVDLPTGQGLIVRR